MKRNRGNVFTVNAKPAATKKPDPVQSKPDLQPVSPQQQQSPRYHASPGKPDLANVPNDETFIVLWRMSSAYGERLCLTPGHYHTAFVNALREIGTDVGKNFHEDPSNGFGKYFSVRWRAAGRTLAHLYDRGFIRFESELSSEGDVDAYELIGEYRQAAGGNTAGKSSGAGPSGVNASPAKPSQPSQPQAGPSPSAQMPAAAPEPLKPVSGQVITLRVFPASNGPGMPTRPALLGVDASRTDPLLASVARHWTKPPVSAVQRGDQHWDCAVAGAQTVLRDLHKAGFKVESRDGKLRPGKVDDGKPGYGLVVTVGLYPSAEQPLGFYSRSAVPLSPHDATIRSKCTIKEHGVQRVKDKAGEYFTFHMEAAPEVIELLQEAGFSVRCEDNTMPLVTSEDEADGDELGGAVL